MAMNPTTHHFARLPHRGDREFGNNSGKDHGFQEEEQLETIALCVVNLFLSCTALTGNVLILLTIWKTSSLHTTANVLLANLAVSDLAAGLVGHPLFVSALLLRFYDPSFSRQLWEDFSISISFLCGASFFTITAIGVDRLLALKLHLRYQAVVTRRRIIWIIISIWAVSGILSSLKSWNPDLFYNALSPLIFTLLVGNFAVYLKIYLIVRRHLLQIRRQEHGWVQKNDSIFSMQRFKRSALNTFLVYILMLFCYLPYSVVLERFYSGTTISLTVRHVTTTVVLLNSTLNPFLYCWRIREIKAATKQLIFCHSL